MDRFKRSITRAVILLLLIAAVWLGRNELIKWGLEHSAERYLGADVRIEHLTTSWNDGRAILKQVAVADPREPMRNLFQADFAVLRFDRQLFSRRKLIIDDARISQVVFGSPRSQSGGGPTGTRPVKQASPAPEIRLTATATDPRQLWLDQFQFSGPLLDPNQYRLEKTAEQARQRLDAELNSQSQKIDQMLVLIRRIHESIPPNDNPLRNQTALIQAQQQLSEIRKAVDPIKNQLAELARQIVRDRDALLSEKKQDDNNLQTMLQNKTVDIETIGRLLLDQDQLQQATEVMRWFLTFRDAIPDPTIDFRPDPQSVQTVAIGKYSQTPHLLIKNLELDGSGRFAGMKMNFSGVARNISTQPELVEDAVTFDIRAQGATHFVMTGKLDRSGGQRDETFHLQCPNFPMPARMLGDGQTIQVSVSPCRAKIDVELSCRGEQLEGSMRFDYDNLVMQLEHLDPLAGGSTIADRINLELPTISDYVVEARIQGPVLQPSLDYRSNLGQRLAATINAATEQKAGSIRRQLDDSLQAHLAALDNQAARVQSIAQRLEVEFVNQEQTILADIRNRLPDSPVDRSLLR